MVIRVNGAIASALLEEHEKFPHKTWTQILEIWHGRRRRDPLDALIEDMMLLVDDEIYRASPALKHATRAFVVNLKRWPNDKAWDQLQHHLLERARKERP